MALNSQHGGQEAAVSGRPAFFILQARAMLSNRAQLRGHNSGLAIQSRAATETVMNSRQSQFVISRRQLLQAAAAIGSGLVLPRFSSRALAWAAGQAQQPAAPSTEGLERMRATLGAFPIQSQPLAENLTLLSGPGGNVVVLHGKDGMLVVDTFVAPAWPKLKESLAAIGKEPVKLVIDTHWHYDHSDNNGPLHRSGATVIAHENTPKRMSETHQMALLSIKVLPSPAEALPQQTFKDTHKLDFGGESIHLGHIPPAHTDTDIYVHFQKADVLHAGDCFFGGMYPFIDVETGGTIAGMIGACDKLLAMAGSKTKIISGHGPIGGKAEVTQFRDMLSIARGRIQKLKSSGKTVQEAVAAKPFADLDSTWGKTFFTSDQFVQIVYPAL
jgi:glyoxylase-like metal-dependent hydrolase (beta-lactamase superfamily II)